MLIAHSFSWDMGLVFAFPFLAFTWKAGLGVTFPAFTFQMKTGSTGGIFKSFTL